MTRYPAGIVTKAPGQLLRLETLLLEFKKQPALFQGGLRWCCTLAAVQDQGVAHAQVPHCGLHCVLPQALEGPQPFETVDYHEVIDRAGSYHHDRHLLALLGHRRQGPPFAVLVAHSKILISTVELVKFQVHSRPPGSCRPRLQEPRLRSKVSAAALPHGASTGHRAAKPTTEVARHRRRRAASARPGLPRPLGKRRSQCEPLNSEWATLMRYFFWR